MVENCHWKMCYSLLQCFMAITAVKRVVQRKKNLADRWMDLIFGPSQFCRPRAEWMSGWVRMAGCAARCRVHMSTGFRPILRHTTRGWSRCFGFSVAAFSRVLSYRALLVLVVLKPKNTTKPHRSHEWTDSPYERNCRISRVLLLPPMICLI